MAHNSFISVFNFHRIALALFFLVLFSGVSYAAQNGVVIRQTRETEEKSSVGKTVKTGVNSIPVTSSDKTTKEALDSFSPSGVMTGANGGGAEVETAGSGKATVGEGAEGDTGFAPKRNEKVDKYLSGKPSFGKNKSPFSSKKEAASTGDVLSSVVLYLFVLAAIFCGAVYLLKRFVPGTGKLFNSPAIDILGRAHLEPRRYISLIRVGKRIIVVGVGPDSMEALAEIDDESEVADILSDAKPKSEAGMSLFQRLFNSTLQDQEKRGEAVEAVKAADELSTSIDELRNRVRNFKDSE